MAMFFVGARGHGPDLVRGRHRHRPARGRLPAAGRLRRRRSRIEMWVDELRAGRFTVAYELFDDGVVASRARSVCVPYDLAEQRPRAGSATPERDVPRAAGGPIERPGDRDHGWRASPDAGAFLARLLRLDPRAVVRLRLRLGRAGHDRHPRCGPGCRSGRAGHPRRSAGAGPGDAHGRGGRPAGGRCATGGAGLPPRARRATGAGRCRRRAGGSVETVPAAELPGSPRPPPAPCATAAAEGVGGRAVGQRVVRDALLDHVAARRDRRAGRAVEVPQRLVQAVVRMGFLGPGRAHHRR